MAEDVILEVAAWVREAEQATVAKLAALQSGEDFRDMESTDAKSN